MKASELIVKALRLINVPGRGAVLSGTDQQLAFEALQDLLNAESVSKYFQTGVRRHFFPMQANKSIYSYGPGAELDTNQFNDPAPIQIEDAYIREGSTILSNEQVQSSDFTTATGWTAGAGWLIANSRATISPGNNGSTLTQTLSLVSGTTYTVVIDMTQNAGSINVTVNQDATPILSQTLAGSGLFSFEIGFAGTASDIVFTADALADINLLSVSVIEKGRDQVELPESQGSDYSITIIDQIRYNRRFTKGTGGRPYEIFYSRSFPNGDLRFDNSAVPGDILIMDVAINLAAVSSPNDEIKLHDSAIKWVKYKLADELSGEYGKQLRPRQVAIMDEAWDLLAAGNERLALLEVDRALRGRPTFDINRGDP